MEWVGEWVSEGETRMGGAQHGQIGSDSRWGQRANATSELA